MDLKEQEILGNEIHRHWYYVSKGRAMKTFLGDIRVPEILDVGAGSGIFSRQLMDANICDSSICVDPNYVEEKSEIYHGKKILFVKNINKTSQKLILMMDVLEHVSDDLDLLRKYADQMDAGTHLFITVPAFQTLWSPHDVFLEHYRRYSITMLENIVKKAGLTPVKSRYFFGILFPAVATIRLFKNLLANLDATTPQSELKVYPDWLNKVLIAIHDIERHILFSSNKLFGLSIFCLCQKRV